MRTDRLRDDDADRSGGRPRQPVRGAPGPGLWRRCCLPYGDARYGVVVAGTKLGLRAGDYPFRGTPWQCTHAAADFRTDPDAVLARIFPDPWRRQPGLGADLGVVVPRCAGAASVMMRSAATPWRRLILRMLPVTAVDFCYGWMLWLFLNWLPSFFQNEYHQDLK